MIMRTRDMKCAALLIASMASIALTACAGNTVGMDVVYRSSQCDSQQPGLFSLKSKSDFEQLVVNDPPLRARQDSQIAADLDFDGKHIVLVAMGQKPTAGYRLRVERTAPKTLGNALMLPIRFSEPAGDMQAQVVTSPCLIVSLDKGAYRIVRAQNHSLHL